MVSLRGEQVLMRIFVGEADKHKGEPLYRVVVDWLRHEGMAGATVLRGVLGFGVHSKLHSANLLRLSQDLPTVIEVVDSRANIDRVLPRLRGLVGKGLVTLERVEVVDLAQSSDSVP